jgi:hypothetical protein
MEVLKMKSSRMSVMKWLSGVGCARTFYSNVMNRATMLRVSNTRNPIPRPRGRIGQHIRERIRGRLFSIWVILAGVEVPVFDVLEEGIEKCCNQTTDEWSEPVLIRESIVALGFV